MVRTTPRSGLVRFSLVLCLLQVGWQQAGSAELENLAVAILKQSGIYGGVVVHLGCDGGELTAALRRSDSYLVHGLDTDDAQVAKAREYVHGLDLYGNVAISAYDGQHLPYADQLVNVLVVSDPSSTVSASEMLRVMAPGGIVLESLGGAEQPSISGATVIQLDGQGWAKAVKQWPKDIDQWTHYLHDTDNNAVARDSAVGPPKRLKWVVEPRYARSHEIDPSLSAMVSASGRLFYIYDEQIVGITDERLPAKWSLIARDAFNGLLLWKRAMPDWGWQQWNRENMEGKDWTTLGGLRGRAPATVARRLVACNGRVYTTLGFQSPLSILDAATGDELVTCQGTGGTDEILVSGDQVVLCVRDLTARQQSRRTDRVIPDRIMALNATSGEPIWSTEAGPVAPLTMAVRDGQVLFCTGREVVCLDLDDGQQVWRAPWNGRSSLVTLQDVVLVRNKNQYAAFAAADGRSLWDKKIASAGGATSADLIVVDGLLWCGVPTPGLISDPDAFWDKPFRRPRDPHTGVRMVGVDPESGEVKKTIDIQNLLTPGHHIRCYRSKATERFILWPKRAAEFIDLQGDQHARNDWVRGMCKYGVMPCNGLLYAPPNQCFCYQGVNLRGFNALAADSVEQRTASAVEDRLVKGPAFGPLPAELGAAPRADAWPTFRHDAARSGSSSTEVPIQVGQRWQVRLGGRLTQPVVDAGRLFVASVDRHTVHALDAGTGKQLWRHTAGGRVDSPPTIHGGLVLFGCADGYVTCLRATDGALVWRFRAAPYERLVQSYGQLESAWPVHGSVLVKDELVYCSAGRSSYLDGGIYAYALEPATGRIIHEGRVDGPHPDLSKDVGQPFSMEGTFSDVLVTDGKYLYIQQVALDDQLNEVELPKLSNMGDKRFGRHVFSVAGFLTDDWWNRTFWLHAERFPGFYMAQQAPKSGQLIVFDETTTFGVKCYTTRNVHSAMFFPGTRGYLLVADENDNEPIVYGEPGSPKPLRWLPTQHSRKELQLDYRAVEFDKGVGLARAKEPLWSAWKPIRIRAMVATPRALFVAGPPDVLPEDDPLAAFEGRCGATFRAIAKTSGEDMFELPLDSPPVFDGMVAAENHLFLSLRNGDVICLGDAP